MDVEPTNSDPVARSLRAGNLDGDESAWSESTVRAILGGLGWPGGDELPVWISREDAKQWARGWGPDGAVGRLRDAAIRSLEAEI